jgi:hypothetical protein
MSKRAGKAVVCAMGGLLTGLAASGQSLPNRFPLPNGSGLLETQTAGGGPNRSDQPLLPIARDKRA